MGLAALIVKEIACAGLGEQNKQDLGGGAMIAEIPEVEVEQVYWQPALADLFLATAPNSAVSPVAAVVDLIVASLQTEDRYLVLVLAAIVPCHVRDPPSGFHLESAAVAEVDPRLVAAGMDALVDDVAHVEGVPFDAAPFVAAFVDAEAEADVEQGVEGEAAVAGDVVDEAAEDRIVVNEVDVDGAADGEAVNGDAVDAAVGDGNGTEDEVVEDEAAGGVAAGDAMAGAGTGTAVGAATACVDAAGDETAEDGLAVDEAVVPGVEPWAEGAFADACLVAPVKLIGHVDAVGDETAGDGVAVDGAAVPAVGPWADVGLAAACSVAVA